MLIFLDIDGVLNALGRRQVIDHVWPDNFDTHVTNSSGTFQLTLSKQLAKRLTDLPATILWTTTWESEAFLVGDRVGIHADWLELGPGWKLAAVADQLRKTPVPYVWLDDTDADPWNESLIRGEFPELPALIIPPKATYGVTPGEMEEVERFVNKYKDAR